MWGFHFGGTIGTQLSARRILLVLSAATAWAVVIAGGGASALLPGTAGGPGQARAGIIMGGEIPTVKITGLTPRIEGIAFDGSDANPIVHDGLGWLAHRVSTTDAQILSTVAVSPNSGIARALAHRSGTGTYYLVNHSSNSLVALDLPTGTRTQVGAAGGIGILFNFLSLASAPDGSLWLGTDRNGGELWTVNTTTGTTAFQQSLTFPGINWQLTALAIDPSGQFFAAGTNANGPREIFRINTMTGAMTSVTSTPLPAFSLINGFSFDPLSGRAFAVVEDRSTSPRSHRLAEITNVPEPTTAAAAAVFVVTVLLGPARRRRAHNLAV